MRPSWTATLLLLVCACQRGPAVYVQIVTAPSVPPLDRLHLMVLQNGELLAQDPADFPLVGVKLPQTVLITSRGDTGAPVEIFGQGFIGAGVRARGQVSATLSRAKPYEEVRLVLVPACAGAGCALDPTTCDAQSARCGTLEDGAGGYLDCGGCPEGQTCGGAGPHRCGTGACAPSVTCASAGAACGYVFDGCKLVSCGGCASPAACTAAHACNCVPTQSCAGHEDGGCVSVDDGCGGTLQCGDCGNCTPDCAGKACGDDDGCRGRCQQGPCPGATACVFGVCSCVNTASCNGTCTDLKSDPDNCGACFNRCSGSRVCAGGKCVCAEPSDNADGHCCPNGFELEYGVEGGGPYCYSNPFPATSIDLAEATCLGMSACLGFGEGIYASSSVPRTADCGSYLGGRGGTEAPNPTAAVVDTYASPWGKLSFVGSDVCGACDGGDDCSCGSCVCSKAARGCTQRFYCVTDPLAPRKAMCSFDDDCPGGTMCAGGKCADDPTYGCCVAGAGCGPMGTQGSCFPSGARATGMCK